VIIDGVPHAMAPALRTHGKWESEPAPGSAIYSRTPLDPG
jgi:hypothetical protein